MNNRSLINRIISHYRIIDMIGKGGMGTVYRGVHTKTGVEVAVKVLHQPGMGERFINEAKVHARLKHPNIARMIGYDIIDSMPCIIMEFINGPLLLDVLGKDRKLPFDTSLNYFRQLCSAISYLHEHDIIHRDIKPDNIKVMPDGVLKLLDFGIAKSSYSPKLTQEGFTIGTVDYMAPEQLKGEATKESDVWSLGVIFYRMLCGQLPFPADSIVESKYKMEMGQYSSPSRVLKVRAKEYDSLVAGCLNRKAERRFGCNELLQKISDIEDGTEPLDKQIDLKNLKLVYQKYSRYLWAIPVATVVLIVFIIGITRQPSKRNDINALQDSVQTDSVKIHVLNANNAKIVFPDHSSYPLPHTIVGKKTEQASFTITAPGYKDLEVSLELNQRRKTFEYVLQKKNK